MQPRDGIVGKEKGMRGMTIMVVAALIIGLAADALGQTEPFAAGKGTSGKSKERGEIKAIAVPAYALASVLVSSVQAPLRGVACVGTAIVGGFAWLLVSGDAEARTGPRDAIRKVCAGPYITTPGDLRGKRK